MGRCGQKKLTRARNINLMINFTSPYKKAEICAKVKNMLRMSPALVEHTYFFHTIFKLVNTLDILKVIN